MATITLPDVYDTKLKSLVTDPFEQTRESLIKDLIDAEVARRNGSLSMGKLSADDGIIRLSAATPGSLSHSKVVSATVDGKELHRPKWNGVREHLLLLALERLGSFVALQKGADARLRQGKFEEDGFKYLPVGDFSVQGVDSNMCWEHSHKLAQSLGLGLKLRVFWREKEGAAHPGKFGVLEYSPAVTIPD
jgi:hypothetical protein